MTATCRFLTTNRASGATLKNGTGGAAPGIVGGTLAGFPMANALDADRGTLWAASQSGAFSGVFDFDLGADYAFDTFAALGIRFGPGVDIANLVLYGTNAATTYIGGGLPTTGWGAAIASIVPTAGAYAPDAFTTFGSVTKRYIRVELNWPGAGQLSFGKWWIGAKTDLGVFPPGEENAPKRARVISRALSGAAVVDDLGLMGRTITLPFRNRTQNQRDTLMALMKVAGTVVYLDAEDTTYECIVTDVRSRRVWQSTTWDVDVALEALP